MEKLQGRRVAILVTDGFEESEMTGPWLLVSAGLMKERTITSWPTLQDDLRNAGANWQDKECIRDANWVSSRKPDDLPAFNRESIAILSEVRPGARPETRAGESAGARF